MTDCFICSNSNKNLFTCSCCNNDVCYECVSKSTEYEKINDILYLNYKCFYCRTVNYIDIFRNDLNHFEILFKQNLIESIKQKETITSLKQMIKTEELQTEQEYYRMLELEVN